VDLNYSTVQQVELGGVPRPRLLLKDVYVLYRSQFRRWFFITAPTSLLASIVLLMADQRIRAIYKSIPRGEIPYHMGEVAETGVLRYGSFFISWFLGCFALAAIATVVNRLNGDDGNSVWISDSYQRARERFGPLLLAACCTFGLFLIGMAAVLFVDLALLRRVAPAHFSRLNYIAVLIGSLIVASMVSWLGMAIPLILAKNIGVRTALKKSVKISNGYEGFLFLLVIESLAGSYVAWYAVHYGLTFLFPVQLRYAAWYGWLVYFVSILASAAVQPPMFIGFSLLAATEPSVSRSPNPE
jgi:hypothetical protein